MKKLLTASERMVLMNYLYNQQNKLRNQFIMPNQIMQLDLNATALAIYFYLRYIEDRKTYQCYPSYRTIGKALKIRSILKKDNLVIHRVTNRFET